MNNYNRDRGERNYRRNGKGGGGGGRKGKGNRNFGSGQRRKNNGNERQFPKFADNDYKNNDGNYNEYWPQNNNNNYNKSNDRHWNNEVDAGILPWHRNTPIIPLVIPPQQLNYNREEEESDNVENEKITQDNITENVDNSIASEKRLDTTQSSVSRSRNNSISTNNAAAAVSNISVEQNTFTVKIKEEKQDAIKLKQEKLSSSSSSSSETTSSDEGLSSEKVSKQPQNTLAVTTAITKESPNAKSLSLPLDNKQKSKTNEFNKTIPSSKSKKKTEPESSSSSSFSSSSEEEEETPKPPQPITPSKAAIKAIKAELQKQETKANSSKKKRVSEEDVICIGNLDNKIVLEDDSDEEESSDETTATSPTNKKSTKTSNKAEKCMICDKKGHTSFQCQMICKNCSAPYHGYRTCPHPANLNTMLQLFLEFCMQQFQQFTADKDSAINRNDNVPKPQVDSPSTHAANKTHKQKRKQSKTPEAKTKSAKKRKLSVSSKKKASKEDYKDSNTDTDSSESDENTAESDNSTSSESLVSSKRKLKLKNKSSTKLPFNMPSFTPNPVNMPLVLNGFPTLATANAVTNPNTSNNALNTLLLTQMFQNAIGSLK